MAPHLILSRRSTVSVAPASLVRRIAVFAAVAAVIGCSSAADRNGSGDAGSDRRTIADPSVDVGSPMRAGWGDAGKDATKIVTDAPAPMATTLSISPLALDSAVLDRDPRLLCAVCGGDERADGLDDRGAGLCHRPVEPFATRASTDEVAAVAVNEGEVIVVGVTTGGATDSYWVRCLPHDFPKLQMTLHPDAGTPTPGYYLVGNVIAPSVQQGYAACSTATGSPSGTTRHRLATARTTSTTSCPGPSRSSPAATGRSPRSPRSSSFTTSAPGTRPMSSR